MTFRRTSHRPCLTFWHWSGVTPYTSSYEFAGSCVFDKQSPGIFRCGPHHFGHFAKMIESSLSLFLYLFSSLLSTTLKCTKWWGQALFRRYGRCFAEFLEDLSLVRLGLLDLSTCVGFGTVLLLLSLEVFLGSVLL